MHSDLNTIQTFSLYRRKLKSLSAPHSGHFIWTLQQFIHAIISGLQQHLHGHVFLMRSSWTREKGAAKNGSVVDQKTEADALNTLSLWQTNHSPPPDRHNKRKTGITLKTERENKNTAGFRGEKNMHIFENGRYD